MHVLMLHIVSLKSSFKIYASQPPSSSKFIVIPDRTRGKKYTVLSSLWGKTLRQGQSLNRRDISNTKIRV